MLRVLLILLSLVAVILVIFAMYIYANKAPDKSVESLSKRWAPPPSQFLDLAGMKIHLRDEGPKNDKTPIVLIHGTSASLHTWDGWVDALKAERRVIRFDLPGFGLTGPEPNNQYAIEHYTGVVVSLLDELKINQAVLAGNSLGGYIAWATAVLHKGRVSKLVLVDASGYPYESTSVPLAFKLSQSPFASQILKDFLPRFLVSRSVRNVFGNPELVSEELIDRYYDLTLREGNRAALRERFKQTLPGQLANEVSTISLPTLILWGEKDRLIPPKFGKRFEQEIANSELLIFEDLGHVPHEENPQQTVAPVIRFLQRQ